jgi:tRNA threonylcarbamoyladenosine biosynthesis protein TsaB
LKDFDALVVGRGPGSFTGLRIGFSVAKAFSVSSGIPVISLGSFFSIAYGFRGRYDKIAVIGDARKGLAYTAAFAVKKGKIAITEKEKLCDLASFIKNKDGYFLVTSDANLIEQSRKLGACSLFHPAPFYPDAKNLAMLAQDLFVKKKFTPLDKLEPLYLHPKTCQIR